MLQTQIRSELDIEFDFDGILGNILLNLKEFSLHFEALEKVVWVVIWNFILIWSCFPIFSMFPVIYNLQGLHYRFFIYIFKPSRKANLEVAAVDVHDLIISKFPTIPLLNAWQAFRVSLVKVDEVDVPNVDIILLNNAGFLC